MSAPRKRPGLPLLKLKRPGHRSHVGGTRRLLGSGKRRSQLADALRDDARAILERIRRRAARTRQLAGGAS